MNRSARTWVQRAIVVSIWLTAFVMWRDYQTSNDLSAPQAGQRFIDAVDVAWWGAFAFVGVYLIRPLVLFPASVITIMGGVLFGPWVGIPIVIVAANTSAMIAFGIGRLLGRVPGSDPREQEPKGGTRTSFVERWSARLRDNSFETVFVMRLLFLPYDLVSYLCGALRIKWSPFLLATALGSIPGTISFVLFGASLERIDRGLGGVNPFAIVAGVAIFFVSTLLSRIVKRRYQPESNLT
jgi:uncharacterized membrane protein YdjX (TVP38/TMEM64 family)